MSMGLLSEFFVKVKAWGCPRVTLCPIKIETSNNIDKITPSGKRGLLAELVWLTMARKWAVEFLSEFRFTPLSKRYFITKSIRQLTNGRYELIHCF